MRVSKEKFETTTWYVGCYFLGVLLNIDNILTHTGILHEPGYRNSTGLTTVLPLRVEALSFLHTGGTPTSISEFAMPLHQTMGAHSSTCTSCYCAPCCCISALLTDDALPFLKDEAQVTSHAKPLAPPSPSPLTHAEQHIW